MKGNRKEVGEEPFSCSRCNFKSMWRSAVYNHIRHVHEKHPNKPLLQCESCDYSTKLPHHMTRHKNVHIKEATQPCPKCDKKFKSMDGLNQHLKHMHSEAPAVKCDRCEFTSTKPSNVKRHFEIVHKPSQYLSCNVCKKEFAYAQRLRDHMRVHGDKEFRCEHRCARGVEFW